MPTFDGYDPGVPCWVDLGSADIAKSTAFYGALFGWEFADQGAQAGHYHLVTKGDALVGGIGPLMMDGQPAVWSTYLWTDDIDKTVELAQSAGGTVVAPVMDVMDYGRMSVVLDPTGAAISFWQPGQNRGAQIANEPGAFCWNELNTSDVESAKAFYRDVVGFEAETSDMGVMSYTEFKLGGRAIAGCMEFTPEMKARGVPPHWLTYFAVEDTDLAVAQIVRLGGAVLMPAMDIPAGRFAVVADDGGAPFAIITLAVAE